MNISLVNSRKYFMSEYSFAYEVEWEGRNFFISCYGDKNRSKFSDNVKIYENRKALFNSQFQRNTPLDSSVKEMMKHFCAEIDKEWPGTDSYADLERHLEKFGAN